MQAITIVGIPNVPVYLFYAKALLWPAGYQYYHIKIPVPPVDPRYTSLRSFLSINNENVVFSDGVCLKVVHFKRLLIFIFKK